ncbi:hypothetical protein ACSSS7_003167 [Eimeria intestinalis]
MGPDETHVGEEDEEAEDDVEEDDPEPRPGPGPQPGPSGSESAGNNGGASGKKASALVCLTLPDVRDNNPFFTGQQWEKIAKALMNSASGEVPSSLALAAVIAGASFL